MNFRKLKLIILILLSIFPIYSFATDIKCSKDGYTISTINGIWTNKEEAEENQRKLKILLKDVYNGEKIDYQYIFNATHFAGLGDVTDAIAQGVFDNTSDYDFTEILNSASEKVKTQKVLLVGHSQGNFYANNIYDKVASQIGGVPKESIGVYSVATPDNRVAGGGKYITSDTDSVISSLPIKIIKRLSPNVHIPLNKEDGNGHSFSDVYLNYQADRIISDIKFSLNKLKNNDIQKEDELCISPTEISLGHKIQGKILAVTDPTAETVRDYAVDVYNSDVYIVKKIGDITLAIGKTVGNLLASVGGIFSTQPSSLVASLDNGQSLGTSDHTGNSTNTINTETISSEDNGRVLGATSEAPIITPNPIVRGGDITGGGDSETAQEIPLIVDTTIPIISMIGDSIVNIIKDSTYVDTGATATDDIDGDITSSIIKSGTFLDTTTLGTYTINYDVKDSSNNEAVQVIRTINIVPIPVDEHKNDFIVSEDTTLEPGEYTYDDLHITNNAKLLLKGDPSSTNIFKGVKINARNIIVDSGSAIYADGQGYIQGPGSPSGSEGYAGSTYGGKGFLNISTPLYGKATEPTDLGSSSYLTWRGGGAIYLVVSGTILNNGIISANGERTASGGSIYVKAKKISGDGIFNSDGGIGGPIGGVEYGSGGGGRIALYYENNLFTGKVEALGACASINITMPTCGQNGTVGLFDTLNNNLLVNSSWIFQKNDSPFNFNNILITDGAIVSSEKDINITAKEIVVDKNSQFSLAENETINIPAISINDNSTVTSSGKENINADTVALTGSSTLTVVPEQILYLAVANLTIEKGSSIDANAKGYIEGPGYPKVSMAGASYGGLGAKNTPYTTYGDEMKPTDFGSGGLSIIKFRGGGAIRLIVSNNFVNDGIISANGDPISSGGSIYITANNFSGSGVVRTDGGWPYCMGTDCFSGGAGGRVAVYYNNNLFTGIITATGFKSSYGNSADGTVKLLDSNIPIIIPSSEKSITSFSFESLTPRVNGVIFNTGNSIVLSVPYGTDIKSISPTIIISDKSSVLPASNTPQDFTSSITYVVTAEDGSTKSYPVVVNISPNPNPDPVIAPAAITAYAFNGYQGDLTVDLVNNPMMIIVTSNKNVEWISLKMEKESDPKIYKIFYSGVGCDKISSLCKKSWNGNDNLSSGELLSTKNYNGNYKVKVHIKDMENNKDIEEYLPSVINVQVQ